MEKQANNTNDDKKCHKKVRKLSTEMIGTFKRPKRVTYVSLTSHPGLAGVRPIPVKWGNADPLERGPICGTNSVPGKRNAIGGHGGAYIVYRALAIASGTLDPEYKPNYNNTEPAAKIGPFEQWNDPNKIVTLDPFGALTQSIYSTQNKYKDIDIKPTIAITKAHIDIPEIKYAVKEGRLKPGEIYSVTIFYFKL